MPGVPLSWTELSLGLCYSDANGDMAIHDGGMGLDFGNLTVEVPHHEALRQPFPRGLVATRILLWYPLQRRQIARPRYFVARMAAFLATASAMTALWNLLLVRAVQTGLEAGADTEHAPQRGKNQAKLPRECIQLLQRTALSVNVQPRL